MAEQSFREIQLGGKQLVFLFMLSVVLAVAVFLLGISVGRGVRDAAGSGTSTSVDVSPADAKAPATMPPPTELTPADQAYHDRLQGTTPPAAPAAPAVAAAASTPAATAPQASRGMTDVPSPVDDAPASAAASGAAAASKAVSNASAPAAAKATGTWWVLAGSFAVRANAERLTARLKGEGYQAVFVPPGTGSSLSRVRVGPFTQRTDADRVAQRLRRDEQGLKPSITH